MRIAEFSVNRRITTLMMTILIVILGSFSFSKLGLEMFPDMNYPVISIVTIYEGASSLDVEESVTEIIEQSIASVKNIKSLSSESLEGASLVMVEFTWGTNLDFAAQDLRDAIDQISDYLPADVSRPLVMKFNLSQMPILMYSVAGGENTADLRKILEDEVSSKLKHLNGVASVMVYGGDEDEKQIIVDKAKIDKYNISIDDIVGIVALGNINQSAGHIQKRKNEYLLRTKAEYSSIEEIANIPIKLTPSGTTIYLKDIAEVKSGFKEKRYIVRTNKKNTAMFMISKESGANTLSVSNIVKKEIAKMGSDLELEFFEIMDMGLPIENTTNGAVGNLIIGGLLAIAIMFLFLRNWRPTMAISLAIPISVIATFIPIYLAKFSLNIMTLGGLALGVGMLVDNSIVVIENIYRHLEMGKTKVQAAKIGATEVAMAITASTLTTIAVFFPMLFGEGITGILVRGLALTVAFSLFASLFVSLTIVPAIASTIFKKNTEKRQSERTESMFKNIKETYKRQLGWVLNHKALTITLVIILFIGSFAMIPLIGFEFLPEEDSPMLMLNLKMPVGTPLEETDFAVQQVEDIAMSIDGVNNITILIGAMTDAQAMADPTNPQDVNEAQFYLRLFESKNRELTNAEIKNIIRSKLPEIKGSQFTFMSQQEMMGGGASNPIELKIFGKDLNKLKNISKEVELIMEQTNHVIDIDNSMKEGKPEVHIVVDKDKAFKLGFTSAQIASAVKTAAIGSVAGIYREGGEEINIRVRLQEQDRNSFDDILHLSVTSPLGFTVPLNQIAHLEFSEGPKKISREKQSRKVTLTAGVTGTQDIGGTVNDIRNSLHEFERDLPAGYHIEYGGSYEDMNEAFVTLTLALILAIILVYAVMASQFESLVQPFVVMFTMPLALIGVLFMLGLTGTTLSVASFVGIIILAGIVVNNGIVLIDHMNQLRINGLSKIEAIIQGGADRVRPVLITASTTILGMLPMAISRGDGAQMKAPMALTVIGGLITATFLTLVIIPVIYSIIIKKEK